jgi:wyosine [tRNA(Phe)-imidazoG37] synthetase (radical SAM superfamily)
MEPGRFVQLKGAAMSRYVFGPVPSRRLGRSLGVDLVPLKTCSYDCIYCQLGRTTCKTVERKEWVPLDAVVAEVRRKLAARPDYITLSGSGEPTLFSRVDELIDRIKAITDIPVAVLTNGSLLWQEEVRRQVARADLVIPSLDAGGEQLFHLVNRPHDEISFRQMLAGLIAFRRTFRRQYWLEVFVLSAYTVFDEELSALRRCIELIEPDRVQLNTVTRPPAEPYAIGLSPQRMAEIASRFDPPAEVIAEYRAGRDAAESSGGCDEILDLLRRRPCTTADIADGLGMHRNEVLKCLDRLVSQELVASERVENALYYRAARGSETFAPRGA